MRRGSFLDEEGAGWVDIVNMGVVVVGGWGE